MSLSKVENLVGSIFLIKTLENYSKIWHNKYIIIYKNYKKEE